jgi:hypothetical protein
MKRNITITLEEELAKEAKILAAQKDTSVSQLLADYLESILKSEKKREAAKEDFFKLTRKKYFLNYSKRQFQRDALHER